MSCSGGSGPKAIISIISHLSALHLSACSKNAFEGAVRVAWDGIAGGKNRASVNRKGDISDFASRVQGKNWPGLQRGEPQKPLCEPAFPFTLLQRFTSHSHVRHEICSHHILCAASLELKD